MNDNPYSPPEVTPASEGRPPSTLCTVMFWLTIVLSLGMAAIAANGCIQYWLYSTQARIKLPPAILAESFCVAFSGGVMLCSALAWRRRLVRGGTIWFACALVAFIAGPYLV